MLWACLLPLLAGTFSLPAQAQTDVTLVSNTGETVAATGADLGGAPADDKQYAAIRFETGSNDRGYTLTSVQASFSGWQTGDVPTVSIHAKATNVNPADDSLYDLTSSDSITNGVLATFTAPDDATLDKDTQYFVVFGASSGDFVLEVTASDDEDSGSADGWSIHNAMRLRTGTGNWSANSSSPRIKIIGSVVPVPAVANAIPDQMATAGTPFSYQIPENTFGHAAGTTLTYTATLGDGAALPGWLSFDATTRTFSGTPPEAWVGRLAVKVTVSDGTDSVSDVFRILIVSVSHNIPALGSPWISGIPQSGQTLTAALGTIRDADGLPADFPDDYSFQWDGSGPGTAQTYTLVDADVGSTIEVRVTFTDGGGTEETRTSDAYPSSGTIQAADTTAPVVSSALVNGTSLGITFDEPLGAAASLANSSFTVNKTPSGGTEEPVSLSGSPAIRGSTVWLTLASAVAAGDAVTVVYTKPTTGTDNRIVDLVGNEAATSPSPTVATNHTATNNPATGRPEVAGYPRVGGVARIQVEEFGRDHPLFLQDADGIATATFTFQWYRRDAMGTLTPISGATGESYTFCGADAGKKVVARVSFRDDKGNAEEVDSRGYPGFDQELYVRPATLPAAVCDAPSMVGRTEVWREELTVGVFAEWNNTLLGWYPSEDIGGFSSEWEWSFFSVGEEDDYHLAHELLLRNNAESGEFRLQVAFREELSSRDRQDLRLHVCDDAFDFEPTDHVDGHDYSSYWFEDPGLDWQNHATRTLYLSVDSPQLEQATVNGATLKLRYSEALETTAPAVAAYEVKVGGTAAGPTAVSIAGNTVTLTLGTPVSAGPTVTLTYRRGRAVDRVQDAGGAEAEPFVDTWVTNRTGEGNAAPVVANAIPDRTATVGTLFSYLLPRRTFSDADGDTLTYTVTQSDDSELPAWLTYTASTRTFSGTPAATDVGTVTVKVTASDATAMVSDTFDIVVSEAPNNAPEFCTSTTRSVPENTAAGMDIGSPVAATDADGDDLTYSLEGTDAASFGIDADTGQLKTSAALDHETKSSYLVTVKVVDTSNASNTIAVTINVTDVLEQPDRPGVPTVNGKADPTDELDVSWTKPGLNGGPDITGYELQFRTVGVGPWSDRTPSGIGTTYTIVGLTANTAYEVQVRALNGETPSAWSPSGIGTPGETTDLTLSKSELNPDEGDSETYTVRLATEPTAAVTVEITGHSGTDLTLDRTRLTFTTTNWSTAQTVRVTAGQDADAEDDTATLRHTASGGDYASVVKDLPVTVDDDESPGVVLSKSELNPDEGGNETYTVRLNTQPTAAVTVAISGHSGTDLTLNKTSLDFTTTNWSTAQTVRVTAGQDDDAVHDTATLKHEASGGDYAGLEEDLPVTVRDDETPGLVLSKSELNPPEGGSESYTVELASEPTAAVTVTISGHSGTDLTLDRTSLTFTASNWDTAQTVTVTAAQDDDGVSDRETLTHAASGGDYGGVGKNLPVRIDDDETPPLVMTVEAVEDTVKEGEPVRYRIIMSRPITGQNYANVESVYSYQGDFVRNGPASVVTSVFSRHGKLYVESELDTLDDAVEENDGSFTVRIRRPQPQSGIDLYGEGEEYTVGTPSSATVTILDNDPEEQPDLPVVSIEPASVMEGPGAELVFRVRLNIPAPRPAEVRWETVEGSAKDGLDFVGASGTLRFATGETEKTVRVAVLDDDLVERRESMFLLSLEAEDAVTDLQLAWGWILDDESATPSASVSGALLTLTYPESLDAGSTPGPRDWVVRGVSDAGARTVAVIGVAVSGPDAVLELAAPATPDEAVSVSYLRWPMHPLLVDAAGVEALPFAELAVRNETPRPSPEVEDAGTPRFDPDAAALPRDAEQGAPDETLSEAAVGSLDLSEHLGWLLQDRPAASVVRLDLPGRALADVSALAGLTGLEVLDLSGNVVADLWPLTQLASLRRADLSENRIADVAALARAGRLQVLDLSGNAVADIWPLAELLPLRRLDLSDNRIADVSALAGLARLEVLLLDGNAVADLAPLAQLDGLRHLGLSGNGIDDVTLLADLAALERLDLSGNAVSEVAPLGDLGRLVWLDLTGNPVSDAAPLGRLTRLRWLWLEPDADGVWALARGASRADAPLRIEPPAAAAAARQ